MNSVNKTEIILTVVFLLLVGFGVLGWAISPVDGDGRPMLLLPDVKAVGDYRRQAAHWAKAIRLLDGTLATVLAGNSRDLWGQSRAAQAGFEDGLRIVQEIDGATVPPALIGLGELMSHTSLAYLEAARAVLRWVSAPDAPNLDQAFTAMESAQTLLTEVESSTWLIP